jgi:hypothetical protein
MGCDVRVVGVCVVQSPLGAEPTQPTEQGVGAPLQGGQSRSQDLEAGMIYYFSLSVCFFINLFAMLDSMLQKKSTGSIAITWMFGSLHTKVMPTQPRSW